jgi:hypothetical protein
MFRRAGVLNNEDYICITDLARYKNTEHTGLRNRNTIELLGIWECLHNPNFKPVEFKKRLDVFIKYTEENRLIKGANGTEEYY